MNEEQVLREYGDYVRRFSHHVAYYLPGGDDDDIEQEALIGLMRACRTFKPELEIPFWPGFALECVRRHLFTAIKMANRSKHGTLGDASRVGYNEEHEEVAVLDLLEDPRADVVALIAGRDELERVLGLLEDEAMFSPLERRAVVGQALGYSYEELSGREEPMIRRGQNRWRDVDNATQRARKKLRRAA